MMYVLEFQDMGGWSYLVRGESINVSKVSKDLNLFSARLSVNYSMWEGELNVTKQQSYFIILMNLYLF